MVIKLKLDAEDVQITNNEAIDILIRNLGMSKYMDESIILLNKDNEHNICDADALFKAENLSYHGSPDFHYILVTSDYLTVELYKTLRKFKRVYSLKIVINFNSSTRFRVEEYLFFIYMKLLINSIIYYISNKYKEIPKLVFLILFWKIHEGEFKNGRNYSISCHV